MTEPIKGLTEGRMVHYVLPYGDRKHRPAVVVQVWDYRYGTSNLVVFRDVLNDAQTCDDNAVVMMATSIHYSEGKEPGTWHWIEQA